MSAPTVHLWLAEDPETGRITVQTREFGDGDFPPGHRGRGWPLRQTDVPKQTWTKLLRATLTPKQQESFRQQWWEQAGGSQ